MSYCKQVSGSWVEKLRGLRAWEVGVIRGQQQQKAGAMAACEGNGDTVSAGYRIVCRMATEGCRQTPAMAPAVLWPHHSPHCAGMMSFSRLCANTRYPQTR